MKQAIIYFFILCSFSVFSQKKIPVNTQKPKDTNRIFANRLIKAYPDFLDRYEDNFIIWKDGTKMIFDDGQNKTFDQLLNNADLQDMFAFVYPCGNKITKPQENNDPGRIRNESFFKKMYGSTPEEVKKNLDTVIWLPSTLHLKLYVTRINGVSKHLQEISNELDTIEKLKKYVDNPAGTFNWRTIAGTNRLSAHSFGIAIDINVKYSNYWRWEKTGAMIYKNQIPLQLVKIFEKHGFIWGGRWYHFDTMHFEYRPELCNK